MKLRLALGFAAGLAMGFALTSWRQPRPATATPTAATATAKAPAASLIHGIPYEDQNLAPSILLHLLALHPNDENRLLPATLITALELNEQEVSTTTAYLRKMADNWTYVVRVTGTDDKWQLAFPEQDAKHCLSDIARWAEETLGPRRGYLLLVLLDQDFRVLFLNEDVALEKNSEFDWSLVSNQQGHSFDLRMLQPASPSCASRPGAKPGEKNPRRPQMGSVCKFLTIFSPCFPAKISPDRALARSLVVTFYPAPGHAPMDGAPLHRDIRKFQPCEEVLDLLRRGVLHEALLHRRPHGPDGMPRTAAARQPQEAARLRPPAPAPFMEGGE